MLRRIGGDLGRDFESRDGGSRGLIRRGLSVRT